MERYFKFSAIHYLLLLAVSFVLFGMHTVNIISLCIVAIGIFAWYLSHSYGNLKIPLRITGITLVSLVNIFGVLLYVLILLNSPKAKPFEPTITFTPHTTESEALYMELVDYSEKEDGLTALPKDIAQALNDRNYDDNTIANVYNETIGSRKQLEEILMRAPASIPYNQLKWDGKIPRYTKLLNWIKLELWAVNRMVVNGKIRDARTRYDELWSIMRALYNGNHTLIGASVTRAMTMLMVEFPYTFTRGSHIVDVPTFSQHLLYIEQHIDSMFSGAVAAEYTTFEQSVEQMTVGAIFPNASVNTRYHEKLIYGYIVRWPFFDKHELYRKVHKTFSDYSNSYTVPYYQLKSENDSEPEFDAQRPPFYKNMLGNIFYATAMPSYNRIHLSKEKAKSQIICLRAYLEGGVKLVEKTIDPLTGTAFIVKKEGRATVIATKFEEKGKPAWTMDIR